MRPLKVGVQLPEVEYVYTWPQLKEMALLAEQIGLDSVWVGDHLMYRYADGRAPRGPFEAWSTLSALAAVTTRVQIGPLVASLGFHNPAMIAKKTATLDQISDGRFILAVGSGWHEPEYRGFGFPYDKRVSRFTESFSIIHTLLTTGACDFHGEFFDLDGGLLFPQPLTPGGPPLMIGSNGKRMLEIALPHVQMWNSWYEDYGNNKEGLTELLGQIDRACEAVNRDPATLIRTVCPHIRMAGGTGRGAASGHSSPGLDGTDPHAVAAELAAYAELGIGHAILVLDPITPASIEALVPVLAELDA